MEANDELAALRKRAEEAEKELAEAREEIEQDRALFRDLHASLIPVTSPVVNESIAKELKRCWKMLEADRDRSRREADGLRKALEQCRRWFAQARVPPVHMINLIDAAFSAAPEPGRD